MIRTTEHSLAAQNGHETMVKLLLARDDIYVNQSVRCWGEPLLLWAATRGNEAVMRQLLERDDDDVNSSDKVYRQL